MKIGGLKRKDRLVKVKTFGRIFKVFFEVFLLAYFHGRHSIVGDKYFRNDMLSLSLAHKSFDVIHGWKCQRF